MTVAVTFDAKQVCPVAIGPFTGSHIAGHSAGQTCSPGDAGEHLGTVLPSRSSSLRDGGRKRQLIHNSAGIHQLVLHFIAPWSKTEGVDILASNLKSSVLVTIPLRGSAVLSQGTASHCITPGMIFLAEPRKPLTASMSADYQQLTLQIPISVLLDEAGIDLRAKTLKFDTDAINGLSAPRLLLDTLSVICRALDSRDSTFNQPMVLQSLQSTLVSLILGLPNNLRVQVGKGSLRAAPSYIGRAEDFMRAHLTDDICIDDLVRVTGVSRRSLHAGFRRFRHTTPLALLKTMKLEAARDEMLARGELRRTVTDIATSYGFYHLSKFARDFRDSFGLLPSEMLKSARR